MKETALFFSDEITQYHLGKNHPMNGSRIQTAYELFELTGMTGTRLFSPTPAGREEVELVHDKEYVEVVRELANQAAKGNVEGDARFGLGSSDCPIFAGMYQASLQVAGSALQGVKLILDGEVGNAFLLMGGLHHAQPRRASGFCYFNDMSVAIQKLRNMDYRVAYIDTDLHHGDGVQEIHYNDPGVLTLSFHESGQFLYPGTGYSNELGGKKALGTSVNLPLFPYTWDKQYQDVMAFIPPIIEAFEPDFIVWQAGVDGHANDPLGHLLLTTNTYTMLGRLVRHLAEKCCGGNLLVAGGGGYSPFSNARCWYAEYAALRRISLPTKTPTEWQETFKARYSTHPPEFIVDESSTGQLVDRPDLVEQGNEAYRATFVEEVGEYYDLPDV